MAKFICFWIAAACFFTFPQAAYAMEVDVRFSINGQEWVTELWCDRSLLWQAAVCCGGAVPALAGGEAKYRTLIVPEFENGLFLLHIE